MLGNHAVAFAMPGGEGLSTSGVRPLDLAHLSRQTFGDRVLEQEVLRLFVSQALTIRDRIGAASIPERLQLAHSLKGSARGVGAFKIADCVAALENSPDDAGILGSLGGLIDEVRDFVAAISR